MTTNEVARVASPMPPKASPPPVRQRGTPPIRQCGRCAYWNNGWCELHRKPGCRQHDQGCVDFKPEATLTPRTQVQPQQEQVSCRSKLDNAVRLLAEAIDRAERAEMELQELLVMATKSQ